MDTQFIFKVPPECRTAVDIVNRSCLREYGIYGLGKTAVAIYNRLFMEYVTNVIENMLTVGFNGVDDTDRYSLLDTAYELVDAGMELEDIGAAISLDDPIAAYMNERTGTWSLDSMTVAEFIVESIPDSGELSLIFEPLLDSVIDNARGCDINRVIKINRNLTTVRLTLDKCE